MWDRPQELPPARVAHITGNVASSATHAQRDPCMCVTYYCTILSSTTLLLESVMHVDRLLVRAPREMLAAASVLSVPRACQYDGAGSTLSPEDRACLRPSELACLRRHRPSRVYHLYSTILHVFHWNTWLFSALEYYVEYPHVGYRAHRLSYRRKAEAAC